MEIENPLEAKEHLDELAHHHGHGGEHSQGWTRYLAMTTEFGIVARQQLTCGQHVHVSIESRAARRPDDTAGPAGRRSRPWST